MTAARWVSLIVGCIAMVSTHWETEDTNVWDMLGLLVWKASFVALIITPLVLEFLERRGG